LNCEAIHGALVFGVFTMFGILFWIFSLLTVTALLALFWNRTPREGRRKPLLLPALGTLVVLAAAGGAVSLSLYAERYGFQPSRLGAVAAWTGLLVLTGLVAVIRGWRRPWISSRRLFSGFAIGALVTVGSYAGMDLLFQKELEGRLEEATARFEALRPPPPADAEDARPVYERAFELLGEREDLPDWFDKGARAVRSFPGKVRALLETKSEALEVAREARGLPAYSVDHSVSSFLGMFGGEEDSAGDWFRDLLTLWRLLRLRCALLASEGRAEEVADHIEWLGDIARQVLRDPRFVSLWFGGALARGRAAALEESLALLGGSKQIPALRFPLIPGHELEELAVRAVEREGATVEYMTISIWLGRVELEDLLAVQGNRTSRGVPFAGLVHGEWLRLYRVFALPTDLNAIDRHVPEAVRRVRRLEPDEPAILPFAEIRELGMGPVAVMGISVLHDVPAQVRYVETAERVARAGQAVHGYRVAEGRYPGSLEDLVPARLEAVPVDARFGRPLRYERLEGGAVVYSAWDGRSDEPLDDPPDPDDPGASAESSWKLIRERSPTLVFLLGAAWEEHGYEGPLEEDEDLGILEDLPEEE
jgi:hypothetical protein